MYTRLKFDNSPDLYADFLSTPFPGFLCHCRTLLNLTNDENENYIKRGPQPLAAKLQIV